MRAASGNGVSRSSGGMGLSGYLTFEDTVIMAHHVVVAEFIARRPFAPGFTEFEFLVHDQVIGNTAETIFVYTDDIHRMSCPGGDAMQFTTDTHYLLVLLKIGNVYASFYDYGLGFITDLIVDLDDPSRSTMYGEPLSMHSQLSFNENQTRERILSHVRSLPRDPFPFPARMFITSEYLEDIINGSPYVVVVEINEPRSLSGGGIHSAIVSTDTYYVTVVEVLKGNMQIGDVLRVIFFADTVFTGETHIVSILHNDPHAEIPFFYRFTSRNSLHCITQRDEIIRIIRGRRSNTDPIELPTPTPTPSPTPSPTPEPEPSPTPEPEEEPEVVEDEVFSRFTAALYVPNEAASINLANIEVEMPEDFVAEMLQLDDLNDMFLHEEMHSIAVMVDYEAADILSIITVYVGDLDLSDVQMLMLRGFVIDPDTGDYTVIPGSFSADRDYFHFELTGSGIIGAIVYELPTPLLRLNINEYRYYYRGSPLTSDVAPFITGNRTMVPIRLVSEALGATPRWDRVTRTAYIYYNDTVLRLPVGEPLPDEMGTPLLRNNRVLVPLRFVIENFDAFTFWDAGLREVAVFVLD